MKSSRNIQFEPEAFDEFIEWASENKKIFFKITDMIEEIRRTPFTGTGKPEALKHDYKGCWSRRITQEHRLIYEVFDEYILLLSFRDHYKDR
jgi:toxin YoeB